MKVVITGGAGFIGSNLTSTLLQNPDVDEVIVIDNMITGVKANLSLYEFGGTLIQAGGATYNLQDIMRRKLRVIVNDCTKPGVWDSIDEADIVFHMASYASPRAYMERPIETMLSGSLGTMQALEFARRNDAVFFFASTSEVYGDPLVSPQPEGYFGNVNPIGPRGVYDESKRFGEALIMAHQRLYGLKTRIGRIFNTYGPKMSPGDGRAVPNFITQALKNKDITLYGSGSQTRSFCYIDDTIRGILEVIAQKDVTPFNIGNPEEHTIEAIAQMIIQLSSSASKIILMPLPEDDPKIRCPDITKIKTALKWEPEVDLETGLKATIKWFRNQL